MDVAESRLRAPSLLESQTAALRRLMPPIDGFGIGGSYGRGAADAYADLDFFLVVADHDFWDVVSALPSLLDHPRPVVSSGVGRFMSDYGYRLAFILEGGEKVEYFVNSPRSMTSLPLSARIRVLADTSGFLTSCLADAATEFRRDVRPHVAAAVHDCLLEIHDLRKHASRRDLLPMVWRLNTLRRPVLALHHMRVSGDVYAPSSAASRLRNRGDDELVAAVDATVPTLDAAAVAAAYRRLRGLMLTSWGYFAPSGTPSREQLRMEAHLSGELLAHLEGHVVGDVS